MGGTPGSWSSAGIGQSPGRVPSLGRLLRQHRSDAGLTIEELADRSGVSPRALGDLERDRVRRPQRRTLAALLDVLSLSAQERALVEQVAGSGRPPSGPCAMPVPPPYFTGRTAAIAAVRALAGPPGTVASPTAVVVLNGQPGAGKTALALGVAKDLADRYPDGQFFVDLRGTQQHPATPTEVLRKLLLALGVGEDRIPADLEELARVYRGLLRHRRTLIVLDNVAVEDQVRPLLPGDGPGLVLLTCRRWLSGLEAVHWLPQQPLTPAESVALLRSVGGQRIGGDEPDPLSALAKHCGHLPLALRIAGQRLHDEPNLTAAALTARLTRAQDRIAAIDGDVSGLATALTVSYRSLSPTGRRMLRRLALIPGPDFTADAAAILCEVGPVQTEDRLDALVECGLLVVRPPDRYGMHDLVRDFASARLRQEEPHSASALRIALVRWLLQATVRAGRHFEPGGPDPDGHFAVPAFDDAEQARNWLDTELYNWLPALGTAAEAGMHDLIIEVADALHWFSDQRLHLGIWPEVFRLAAEAALHTGDARLQAVHLNYLSWAEAVCVRDYHASLGAAEAALRCARLASDRGQEGWAQLYASSAQTGLGAHKAALRLRQRAWVAFRAAGDYEGLPQAMAGLGSSLRMLGRPTEALSVHRRTLRLLRDPGYPMADLPRAYSDAMTCRRIGADLAAIGQWTECVDALGEALAGLRACGLRTEEATVMVELADALRRTGASTEAAAFLAAAVELADALGDSETAVRAHHALADLSPSSPSGPR